MNIYVTRDGQNYGPYTHEQAHAMIAQAQLYTGDLACPEGQSQWVPLGQILGIPPQAAPPPPPVAHAAPIMPAAPRVAPAIPAAAPLAAAAPAGVPVAQPATAVGAPVAAPAGPTPGGPAAHFAIQQAYLKASGDFTKLGLAAALAVVGLGLPLLAWAAGDGTGNAIVDFFGQTLGIKWAALAGLVIAALCLWWFFVQKKTAAASKANFEGMRLAGL